MCDKNNQGGLLERAPWINQTTEREATSWRNLLNFLCSEFNMPPEQETKVEGSRRPPHCNDVVEFIKGLGKVQPPTDEDLREHHYMRHGLCNEDARTIADMTLHQISEELYLPVTALVDIVQAMSVCFYTGTVNGIISGHAAASRGQSVAEIIRQRKVFDDVETDNGNDTHAAGRVGEKLPDQGGNKC